ncbi:receptor-like protein Cf-9 [Vitis riparia]|uniref:receptor-like protein Cf-9 n=1 Tax=Vitis riparia TaxID=96939 RepID=UPI00155A41B6|nr:receptor-like protein Cf-9 [Vitis riparia]
MSTRLLLCFLFFLSSSQLSFSNSTQLCPRHQTLALLHLKQSFSINNSSSSDCHYYGVTSYPKTESWKKGSDCCSWDGVTCDWVTGHVIELDLSCSWLFGTIHSNTTLFLLPHLQRLNLAFNNFSGSSVSAGFGRFSSLTHLNLFDSRFSGLISPEISHLSNLVSLDLSWNIDTEFAPYGFNSLVQNLTKLQKLHLGDLSGCGLHGRFPNHDIHLPKLEVLNLLENNDLNGNFPRFSENNSLKEFSWDCDSNGITSYPKTESWNKGSDCCSWDGVTCDRVTGHVIRLDLSCSWLYGTIHSNSTLFLFTHLQRLNLAFNDFNYSSVSAGFGRFSSLTYLNLSESLFSGPISHEISHLSKLVSLDLSWNSDAEFAPHGFNSLVQNLTKLQKLHLGGISISSVFPNSLLNRSNLISLDLSLCGLHGRFSDHEIHLPKLEVLNLEENDDLSGNFPRFSENNSLMELDLSFTNLSGELSASIGNLQSLQTLDLSDCEFSGSIPTSIGNLKSLKTLDLSDCEFSGSIPTSIGCSKIKSPFMSLRIIDLAHNDFEGDLPEMYLRRHIPSSFGNLKLLESLDLSSNKLIGRIPQELTSLTFLEVLNLSQNHFTGFIPRGNQFDTFGNDSYNENSGLCGFPLSKKCIIDETPESSKEADAEFDGGFDWKITLMGYGCGLVIGLSLGCLVFLIGKPKRFVWIIEEIIHKKIKMYKRSTCRQGVRRN